MTISARVLFIILICLLGFESNAQSIAIKGGVNVASVSFRTTLGGSNDDIKYNVGFHIGSLIDFKLSDMFSIETGIQLTTKGYKSILVSDHYSASNNFYVFYSEIPLSIKYQHELNNGYKIYTSIGGYGSLVMFGLEFYKNNFNGDTYRSRDFYDFSEMGIKRLDYGLTFGVGIEMNSMVIGTSFDLGLVDIIDSDNYTIKNRVLKFSIGYRFGNE